jgi:hypothetical protein
MLLSQLGTTNPDNLATHLKYLPESFFLLM